MSWKNGRRGLQPRRLQNFAGYSKQANAAILASAPNNGKRPGALLRKLVAAGHNGVRTGRGFYKWDTKTVGRRLEHFSRLMEGALGRVKRRGEPTEF